MAHASQRVVSGRVSLPSRLPSLTGLRFIAAALVFCDHVRFQWTPGPFPSGPLFGMPDIFIKYSSIFGQGGATGVSFFFILSGFVLSWSTRPEDTARAFWRRRFFKVFPNHIFNWAVLLLLFAAVSGLAIDKGPAIINVLLLQSWFPKYTTIFSVNPMAWSLSCEALFYLSFPLLARLISRIRPERLWAWATAVAAAIFLMPVLANALPHHLLVPGMPLQMWFIYIFPPVRMLEFVFGIVLARIVMTGQKLPFGLGAAVALAVTAYFVQAQLPTDYTYVAIMVVPLGLVIAAAAVCDAERRPTLVSRRVMVWLGNVSFAFYLWHYAVLAYGHEWLGGPRVLSTPAAVGRLALYFVVALAVSAAVYYLVERPVYRRFAGRPGRASLGSGATVPLLAGANGHGPAVAHGQTADVPSTVSHEDGRTREIVVAASVLDGFEPAGR